MSLRFLRPRIVIVTSGRIRFRHVVRMEVPDPELLDQVVDVTVVLKPDVEI